QALALLRRGQTLVFVTPKRSWRGLPGGAIQTAHRRHPHRVRVLDWLSFSAGHDAWFYADGTHLRPSGARAYARLLAHALRWMGRDDCACEAQIDGPGWMLHDAGSVQGLAFSGPGLPAAPGSAAMHLEQEGSWAD